VSVMSADLQLHSGHKTAQNASKEIYTNNLFIKKKNYNCCGNHSHPLTASVICFCCKWREAV